MLTVTRAAMLGLALLIPPAASAQSEATGQLWGNLTLDWHKYASRTHSISNRRRWSPDRRTSPDGPTST